LEFVAFPVTLVSVRRAALLTAACLLALPAWRSSRRRWWSSSIRGMAALAA